MMKTVLFTGWNYGLQKVALTKLLRSEAHLPLSVAKDVVDQLLDGRSPEIVLDDETADRFVQMAEVLGAQCVLL
jgi:hypothetical protein